MTSPSTHAESVATRRVADTDVFKTNIPCFMAQRPSIAAAMDIFRDDKYKQGSPEHALYHALKSVEFIIEHEHEYHDQYVPHERIKREYQHISDYVFNPSQSFELLKEHYANTPAVLDVVTCLESLKTDLTHSADERDEIRQRNLVHNERGRAFLGR